MDENSEPLIGGCPVQVHLAGSVAEAHVVASALDASGIPTTIYGIEHATMVWDNQIALGGLRIVVPEHFAEAAKKRLSEIEYRPPLWQSDGFWRRWYLYAPFVMLFGLSQAVFVPWIRPNGRSYLKAMILLIISMVTLVSVIGYVKFAIDQNGPNIYRGQSN